MSSPEQAPIRPQALSLENLTGTVVLHTNVLSYKNRADIHPVDVHIVHEGSGMVGLTETNDNKEWSGMWNHVLKTTRFAVYIAQQVDGAGISVDGQLILDAHLNSHTKRREWDEAKWYPGVNPGRYDPDSVTNEKRGVLYLKERNTPERTVQIVEALAHGLDSYPQARDSWEYRIAIYADHRTSQQIESLKKRMGDFFIGGYASKLPQDQQQELRNRISSIIDSAKEDPLQVDIPRSVAYLRDDYTIEKVNRGVPLETFLQLVIDDAITEKKLEDLGLHPDAWVEFNARLTVEEVKRHIPGLLPEDYVYQKNDSTSVALFKEKTKHLVAQQKWERYLRRLYLQDAEKGNFEKVAQVRGKKKWRDIDTSNDHDMWKIFNQASWWGKDVIALYRARKGKPYTSTHKKPNGIQRAIIFFKKLDQITFMKSQNGE